MWFGVAAVVNVLIAGLAAAFGGVVDQAVAASLLVFCISIGARHDGIVRAAFAVGRTDPVVPAPSVDVPRGSIAPGDGDRRHGLVRRSPSESAVASGDRVGQLIGAVVLAILVTMMWTARNAVRHTLHNRFELIHRYGGWTALAILVALVLRQLATSLPPGAGLADVVDAPTGSVAVAVVVCSWRSWCTRGSGSSDCRARSSG